MAFHSHGRLGETVPAGGRNGRDGRPAPSGEWVVNDEAMEEF
jgi:phage I-like protein